MTAVRNINSKLNAPKTVKKIRDLRNSKKPKVSPNYKKEIFADKKYKFPPAEYRKTILEL